MAKQLNDSYAKLLPGSIFPLLMGCYFFPLMFALFFLNAENKGQTGFALSIGGVILSAFVLFLRLKKWEHDFQIFVKQNVQKTPPKPVVQVVEEAAPPARINNIQEELLKQKEDEIMRLAKAHDQLMQEKDALIKENDASRLKLCLAMDEKMQACQQSQEIVQLKEELLQKKDETITELQKQISNLNFEMKTLLKLASK
jgi:hypothetical protein